MASTSHPTPSSNSLAVERSYTRLCKALHDSATGDLDGLRIAVMQFAIEMRAEDGPAEHMLIVLKECLAEAATDPWEERRLRGLSERIVAWAIDDFYAAD